MEPQMVTNTLRDYLRILFRQKWVVFTAILTVTLAVFIGLSFKTPVYEAQVKVLVSSEKQVQSIYYRDISSGRTEVTMTQGEIVKSAPVIERTVEALSLYKRPFDYEAQYCSPWKKPLVEFFAGLQTEYLKRVPDDMKNAYRFLLAAEELKKKIKVDPIRETNTFTISVRDYDPVNAALTVNTLSRSYLIYDLEQQLAELRLKYGEKHPSVLQLQENVAALAKTLHGQPVSIQDALGTASSKVVEQARAPFEPVGVSKVLALILGFIMSFFIGGMLAFFFESMDQTFKTPREIETVLGLPFLGAVPKKKRLKPNAVQTLADQIYIIMKDRGLKSVMIAGIDPSGASAAIASSLAKELTARSAQRVLMIDADLRSSGGAGPGIVEILEGRTTFDTCLRKGHNLTVLASAKTTPNPMTLVDSAAMCKLLKTAKDPYDMVFVNVPPLMPFKDGEVLSSLVDGVVIVVTEGKTRRQVAQAAIKPLRDKKVNLIGAVLNDRTFTIPKFLYERT